MDTHILEDIGLTEGETKVYLALLRLGTTKTGALAAKAEVSSSKVYKILGRLQKKGLAGHVTKGKTMYFKAMKPRRILEYMEEKEQELQRKKELVKKLLPQLEAEEQMQKTGAVVLEGFKGISNFFMNILDELFAGDEYYVLGANYGINMPGVRSFFYKFHTLRAKKKIKVKMLANHDTKYNLEPPTFVKGNIRFLPQYLMNDMSMVFYKNKSFIFFLTKEPMGFLIESEEVARSFQAYFDVMWKMADSK
jgi:HTH-type transcriptional regulator, sugar sensing transcriptional regulator